MRRKSFLAVIACGSLSCTSVVPPGDLPALAYRPLGRNVEGFEEYERLTDGMVVILVPEGGFTFGDKRRWAGAIERHITLSAYVIDKYEVSLGQFRRFHAWWVSAGRPRLFCRDEPEALTGDDGCYEPVSTFTKGDYREITWNSPEWGGACAGDDYPVRGIPWHVSVAYGRWAHGDVGAIYLPSEAQWERAARGTDGRRYPWGDEKPAPDRANVWAFRSQYAGQDIYARVNELEKGRSPVGAFNMCGNVGEWCVDRLSETHLRDCDAKDPVNIRTGHRDESGEYRSWRGGGMGMERHETTFKGMECAQRYGGLVGRTYAHVPTRGIRCAAPATLLATRVQR